MGTEDFLFGLYVVGKTRQDRANAELRQRLFELEHPALTARADAALAALNASAQEARREFADRWSRVVALPEAAPYLRDHVIAVEPAWDEHMFAPGESGMPLSGEIICVVWVSKPDPGAGVVTVEANGYIRGDRIRTGNATLTLPHHPDVEAKATIYWDDAPGKVAPPVVTAGVRSWRMLDPSELPERTLDDLLRAWDTGFDGQSLNHHRRLHDALASHFDAEPDRDHIRYVRTLHGERVAIATLEEDHLSFTRAIRGRFERDWQRWLGGQDRDVLSPSRRTLSIWHLEDERLAALLEGISRGLREPRFRMPWR